MVGKNVITEHANGYWRSRNAVSVPILSEQFVYCSVDLGSEGNFRLLSNGEVIEVLPEDESNVRVAEIVRLATNKAITIVVTMSGGDRNTRSQYQWWQIPEYWIIDRHRSQITALRKSTILRLRGSMIAQKINPDYAAS